MQIEQQLKLSKDIQWQYKDSNSNWKNFPLYINSLIESKYNNQDSTVSFENEDNENCIIYLNVNPMIYSFSDKEFILRRLDITNFSESFEFPKYWVRNTKNYDFNFFTIDKNSLEYSEVSQDFLKKLQSSRNKSIQYQIKIERIQNEHLYKQYSIHREKFIKENKTLNELDLFHGSNEDSIKKICKFGFNRSFCGVNGAVLGNGVYFAKNSSYSDKYAIKASNGYQSMIRAKVLIGVCCYGNDTMKTPPERSDNKEPYDSSTDSSQTIFACYHDNQCYPEYLIIYK